MPVVSIYTNNRYQSFDLDFISFADKRKIKVAMESIGFRQDKGRHFIHPNSDFFVEFPGTAVVVGDQPVREFSTIEYPEGILKLLTPTDSVKDRLAAFYHWNDPQALQQAVWITESQPVNLSSVRKWSEKEGMLQKYSEFTEKIRDKA